MTQQILTDEEINAAYKAALDQSLRPQDHHAVHKVSRAIEAAVLAKLAKQEPVAEVFDHNPQHGIAVLMLQKAFLPKGTKLFTLPQPAPDLQAENKQLAEATELYDLALKASWPEGAIGEASDYWNSARIALASAEVKS